MTERELAEIEERAARERMSEDFDDWMFLLRHAQYDIPALVAEVRQLKHALVECCIPLEVIRMVHADCVYVSNNTMEAINSALDTARKAIGE